MSATLKTNAPRPGTWRAWLLDSAPESRTQARLGAWFRGWLALRRNPLARLGLHPPDWRHAKIKAHALRLAREHAASRRVIRYRDWVGA